MLNQEQVDRFWTKIDKSTDPNGCWLWTSSKSAGYGSLVINKKFMLAHRVAFMLENKCSILKGIEVMHSCDNPGCVNPSHLSLGTHSDNMKDMVNKGRHGGGRHGLNGRSLTRTAILDIRSCARPGRGGNTKELAKKYGVTIDTISKIIKRHIWKQI